MLNHSQASPHSKVKLNILQIINALPEEQAYALEMYARFLASQVEDPVLKMLLLAEEDDEPLTPEEVDESEANWQAVLRGEGIPWEEVRKELVDE